MSNIYIYTYISLYYDIYIYIYLFIYLYYIYIYYLSKEVGKQYFRVTNDFYLMELTMMKGGARVRLDLDEGWCEPLHYMTIQSDEGWCASET